MLKTSRVYSADPLLMLNAWSSHALCVFSASLYVFSLYLLPERVRKLPRDNVEHVKWRMSTSTLSSLLTLGLLAYYYESVRHNSHLHHTSLMEALGLQLNLQALRAAWTTILLMGVFYAGPMLTRLVTLLMMRFYHIDGSGRISPLPPKAMAKATYSHIVWSFLSSQIMTLESRRWLSVRDHLFAPVSEEFVFRSIIVVWMLAKYQMGSGIGDMSTSKVAWEVSRMCPLWFALAHVHHAWAKVSEGLPWKRVLLSTLVQCLYTSIFGYIAVILLLRTGTILAPIASHIVCNLNGLPNTGFLYRPEQCHGATEFSSLYKYRLPIMFAYFGGLILFAILILPMTEEYSRTSALWFGRAHPIMQ